MDTVAATAACSASLMSAFQVNISRTILLGIPSTVILIPQMDWHQVLRKLVCEDKGQ